MKGKKKSQSQFQQRNHIVFDTYRQFFVISLKTDTEGFSPTRNGAAMAEGCESERRWLPTVSLIWVTVNALGSFAISMAGGAVDAGDMETGSAGLFVGGLAYCLVGKLTVTADERIAGLPLTVLG